MKTIQPDFTKLNGLVPAIIQDDTNGTVYMLGFMNAEAYEKTCRTRSVCFYSRSRKKLWKKGETSGNTLTVTGIFTDCDADTLLIKARLNGSGVCHTGSESCFSVQNQLI
jgi:phosphoribosyl-ATP pyrophosphohydrolase/phosphoribosyl-AMP cyclohydrolase